MHRETEVSSIFQEIQLSDKLKTHFGVKIKTEHVLYYLGIVKQLGHI